MTTSSSISRRNFIKTAAGAAAVAGIGAGPLVPTAHAATPGPDTRFTLDDSMVAISTNVALAVDNERLQSAAFGANGKLFTMQQPEAGGGPGNLVLSRVQWNSGTDTIGNWQSSYGRMNLNGFGHGQQFGVSWDGTDHWIYMECDSRQNNGTGDGFGCKLCKFKWKEGDNGTYTFASLETAVLPGSVVFDMLQPRGSESSPNVAQVSCALDTITNKLVLRFNQLQGTPAGGTAYTGSAVGWNFALYDASYDTTAPFSNRLTNNSTPIQPCFRGIGAAHYVDHNGVTQTSSPAQGMCFMENVFYEISGTGWPSGSCGPSGGDTGNVVINSWDIRTRACHSTHITGALALNIREPEGCWVQRTGTTQRLMFCLTSAPTCPIPGHVDTKRANFYVKSTLSDVVMTGCS